jgi:beta-lactam-binding protein with PASTA domain
MAPVRAAIAPASTRGGAVQQARQRPSLSSQLQAASGVTLDFETGDLRGWTASGNAFATQPTFGDNSRARGSEPANQQGDFWIGTFENHPRDGPRPGAAQGDGPQGTLTSGAFNVPGGTLSFLVGGGASFETRVELRVIDPIEGSIRVAFASGSNSEAMRRVTWELDQWSGRRAQIVIIDASSAPWGHINVDDFRFSALEEDRPELPDLQLERPPQLNVPPQVATTRVPDLVGGSLDAARERIADAGLRPGEIDAEPSSRPRGVILRQDPEAGAEVRIGSAVNLVVATSMIPDPGGGAVPPTEAAVVPGVIGRDVRAALEMLRASGYQGRVVDRREATQPPGTVISQTPQAGSRAAQGAVVELVTAIPVTVAVPNLVGRSEAAARRALQQVGLAAGRVGRRESEEPPGTVVAQGVEAGTRIEQEARVDFEVAVPVTREVPDVVGLAEQEARRQIEAAELSVGTMVETESRREPGVILTQSEQAGSRVVRGTRIDLLVAVPVTVEVPDLSGRSVAEAQGLLEGVELAVGSVSSQESREPEGSVLSQQPLPGTRAETDSEVDLVIAEPVTVLVPDVVGFAEQDALRLVGDAELAIGTVTRRESRQPVGTVLEQDLAAGTRVTIGTPVSVVLAEPVTVLVPEVVGSSEAEATAAIEAAELAVGQVQYQESPAAVGTVLTQSLNPGTRVQIGSAVNLLVAVVETVAVPEVVGIPVEEARRALVTGRLAVGTEELRETRVEPEGTVMEQSREPGTVAAVGTPVSLVVATPEIIEVPSLVGLSEEEAVAAITGAGLVVGAVGEQLSMEAGGTVLEQAQPAGSAVVFGTPIGLQVARSRAVWAIPAGLLLLCFAAAGSVVARRRARRRGDRRPQAVEQPDEPPPLPEIRVRPVADAGRQAIAAGDQPVAEGDIRLRPRVDPGRQEIESADDLIAGERRQDD